MKCSAHVDPVAAIAASEAINWPDKDLHKLILEGVAPLGPQKTFGIYRKKITTPASTIDEMTGLNKLLRERLHMKAPPPAEQAAAIWEKKPGRPGRGGLLSDWFSEAELDKMFGQCQWMASIRLAIWQTMKYRLIDDASEGQNQTFGASEQIHTTSATAAASLTRRYREVLGSLRAKRALQGSSRDMKKAYTQISVCDAQRGFVVIAVYDPTSGC